ncbi:chemotaxis protein CheW [Shewanella subflava]|uniref:Chemotaxis protein CheW n=1 Tax=Shewanella subflava TaxID=2986476 RepID=A0ABT3IC37_9GAMM|nr:chemotaxis protein CheW [Shewanella subflava]MCW3173624.1 chemotaxis protein CheW [Shewanella subflava]
MSKSVDETVFDYFALLLKEPGEGAAEKSAIAQSNKTQDAVAPKSDALAPLVTKKSSQEIPFNTKPEPSKAIDDAIKSISSESSEINEHFFEDKNIPPVGNPAKSIPSRLSQPAQKVLLERNFADPVENIDKKALEKLLSAVSKTENQTATDTASKPTMTVAEIKASADKVRQALGLASDTRVNKTSVASALTQKTAIADKEIKPLVDIKLTETTPSPINKAIINCEQQGDNVAQPQLGATPPSITEDLQQVLDDEFQVLFFKVAGLTLAVPLVSLGGIVKVERINHLIGRPKWFLGVQPHREEKINVVDTCAWVMPEKYSSQLAESIDYQYLVMLEDSRWGLACESLVNAVKIDKSHVNWREKPGKRPWLAGVVKQQMCGILHVQALIDMLDAGLGCQDSIDRG